jgi:hypothetical protein
MSRTRLMIPAALLAAFALSVVALAGVQAGAGAEEPKKCGVGSPTTWAFCYAPSKEEIGAPVQLATGSGGVAILAATIGSEVKIECKENTLTAELKSSGKGVGTLTLFKCKETKPAHCRITAAEEKEINIPLKESLTGKLETPGTPEAVFTGTGAGEELITLVLERETTECPVTEGSYKVTGKQNTELPEAEKPLVEHEFIAKKSGSNFKIGGNEATLSVTDKVKLTTTHEGSMWDIGLGT